MYKIKKIVKKISNPLEDYLIIINLQVYLITVIRKKKQNQQHKVYFHNHYFQIKINPKRKRQIYLINLKKTQKILGCSQIFLVKKKLRLKKAKKRNKKNQIMVDFLVRVTNKKLLVVFLMKVKLREVYLIIIRVGIFLVIIKVQKVQTSLEISLPKSKELLVYLAITKEVLVYLVNPKKDFLVIIKIKKLKKQVFFLLWVINRSSLIHLEIFSEICFKIMALVEIFYQVEITKILCFYKAEEMTTIKKKLILLTLIKNL